MRLQGIQKIKTTRLVKNQNIKLHKVRTTAKINRNDICICGSGLKYKKCCI